jgi:hypothetical protein
MEDRRPPRSGCGAGSVASAGVVRGVALSSATAAWLAFSVSPSAPPSTEPPTDAAAEPGAAEQPQLEGTPDFERKLAELAFALYLGTELDIESGRYSCTQPSSLEVGETIVCFTLVDSDRVVVARTELTDMPGVYEFELVSDQLIQPGAATTSTTSTTTSSTPATTTSLPPVFIVTTTAAPTPADTELLAFGDSINAEAQDFVDNLTAGDEDLIESATYSWDPATATVSLDVAFAPSYAYPLDTAAWIFARDRAMDLWNRDSPFRAEGATIRPSLEIVVNDARYVSDFNLCLRVADQTIAIDDWVRASHRT